MICPLCGSSLELKQINFTIAIYICLDVKCPYPANGHCLEVYRKLEDINSNIKDIPLLQTVHNNNTIESVNNNSSQLLPENAEENKDFKFIVSLDKNSSQLLPEKMEENKDFDLNMLIDSTLLNLENCMNQIESTSMPTTGQDGSTYNAVKIEQSQSVHMNNNEEHLDQLEIIFSELK